MSEKYDVEGTTLPSLIAKIPKNNTSGVKGVFWDKSREKWSASITFQGKKISLGRFDIIEDAAKARKAAEEKYHKPMLEKYKDRLTPEQLAKLEGNECES